MKCFPCIQRRIDARDKKKQKTNDRGVVVIEEEPYIGPITLTSTAVGCFFIGPFSLFFLLFPCDRRPNRAYHMEY